MAPPFRHVLRWWTIEGMRGLVAVVLVGALAGACSGRGTGNGAESPPPSAAGKANAGVGGNVDAGASTSRVVPTGGKGGAGEMPAAGSGERSEAGTGGHAGGTANAAGTGPAAGSHAPEGGQGGAVVGGTGGAGSGGTAAPVERVLWSQTWTVAIHTPMAQPGFPNATMGLALDAGEDCRFGFVGAASGSTQTYPTDGACITAAANVASGKAIVFDQTGKSGAIGGSALLTGWTAAVTGHRVTAIRRTQTYTVQLLGAPPESFNYADFEGRWEAIGF